MGVQEASIAGFFKTALILIGVLVLLRFLGRVMIAKRNLDEEREMLKRDRDLHKERDEKLRNFGRVSISGKKKSPPSVDAEDVDFEEVK